jgi:uncharacterized membrane protein
MLLKALHSSRAASVFPYLGYPPLGSLWLLPALWTPFWGVTLWLTLLAAIWVVLLVKNARASIRLPVLAALLVQTNGGMVLHMAITGNAEFVPFALATLSLLWIPQPRRSAVLFGLALASNQLMWLLLIPYLLLTRRLPNFKARTLWLLAVTTIAIVPGVFLYPDMLRSVLQLFVMPTFNYGMGLLGIFLPGSLPQTIRVWFTVLMMGAYALGSYFAYCRLSWALAFLPLATAVAWLGWRSDANYLSLVFPLTVGALIGFDRLRQEQQLGSSLASTQ